LKSGYAVDRVMGDYLGDCCSVAPTNAAVRDLDGDVLVVDERPRSEHATCLELSVKLANVRVTEDDTQTGSMQFRWFDEATGTCVNRLSANSRVITPTSMCRSLQ